MKISFDFDDTLSRKDVQLFAQELVSEGVEVWITTSRYFKVYKQGDKRIVQNPDPLELQRHNWDIWLTAFNLDIPMERVTFTGSLLKVNFLKDKDFIAHLDDDLEEIEAIQEVFNSPTSIIPINVNNSNYQNEIREWLMI